MPLLNVFLGLLLLMVTSNANSFDWNLSTEVGVVYHEVNLNDREFHPYSVISKFGYALADDVSAELHVGTGALKDETGSVELMPVNLTGFYLRKGTNFTSSFRSYIAAGLVSTTWDEDHATGSRRHDFSGFSWGIGFEERLKSFRDMSFTLVYMNYHKKNNVSINGVTAAYRVDF